MNECELYQELISRLVDGEISRKEYAILDAHMENCAECSAMYAVFASLSDIIGTEAEPLPEDLHEDIMAGVRRSAMINRNRRRLSKPLRNSLAAAACAALVLFAARGLSPAEKAGSTMLNKNEAAIMDMQQEVRQQEDSAVQTVEEAAPAAMPVEEAAPAPAAPAATAAPTPLPQATVQPTASPVPTEDIYLGGDEDIYAAADNKVPAATVPPTEIYVNTPSVLPSIQPKVQPTAEPQPVNTPAAMTQAEPEIEEAAAAPAAMEPETEQQAAYSAEPEAVAESESAAGEAPAEPEPAPTQTPSLQKRLFSFFGLARPAVEAEPEAAPETEIAAAGPVATETPAQETEAQETPEAEKAEEKKPVYPVKLESLEKLTELENLIDGDEAALPQGDADEEYIFSLAKPEEMFEDYKIKVLIFADKVYYEQYFAENDFIVCLSKCSAEDFNKFMDSLSDSERAALPSPSPSVSPAPTPELAQPEAQTA